MKIGLVRHFEVIHESTDKKPLSRSEYLECLDNYDISDIKLTDLGLSTYDWHLCYTSDLPRAVKTTNHIYNGQIKKTELLREIRIYPFTVSDIKLSFSAWTIFGRLAWMFSHKSQSESKAQTLNRIRELLSEVFANMNQNVLIVSHGALMYFLQKELLKTGFKGDKFVKTENGILYVFEKNNFHILTLTWCEGLESKCNPDYEIHRRFLCLR